MPSYLPYVDHVPERHLKFLFRNSVSFNFFKAAKCRQDAALLAGDVRSPCKLPVCTITHQTTHAVGFRMCFLQKRTPETSAELPAYITIPTRCILGKPRGIPRDA